ncbi:MAG: hypothetical protein WC536_04855 [Patescibacteria group bacterium]
MQKARFQVRLIGCGVDPQKEILINKAENMTEMIKQKLSEFRYSFFREKYRFDQGNAFLVFLNFSLLVMSLVRQNNGNPNMVYWYVVMGFIGTWILGYFLDKIVRVQDASERVAFKRSPIWKENFSHHKQINKKIEKINTKIDNIHHLVEEIKRLEDE